MLTRPARRLPPFSSQARRMGLDVKKNQNVEEWNGLREKTEYSFEWNSRTVSWSIATCIVIPYFVYSVARAEMENNPSAKDIFKGNIC